MPLQRGSLRSFLSSARNALNASVQHSSPVTFVIGNESADLDSLCSALVLAYLRTYASSSKSNTIYIPLSNLPRADLSLRPELIPVLSHANLKPSDLITLSDLPAAAQQSSHLQPAKTRWILVDHNALQGELGQTYSSRLVGCIDHHDEEGKVPKDCGNEPRIVRKSGSCSSLVVEYCREAWDALSKPTSDEQEKWDSELAYLALAPVLIDTTNLTIESKVKPADVEAAKYLGSRITDAPDKKSITDKYFEEVSAAKQNIGGLSLVDILRKDYKQWSEAGDVKLGISSVVKDIPFLVEKAGGADNFFDTLKFFAGERGLSICSVMTTSHKNGIFRRELFVWAMNERGANASKKFEADSKESLGLQQWNAGSLDADENGQWRRCWWQGKIENSRKQVAPLMRATMS